MRELTKSTLSLAWAVPLFGAKQILNFVKNPTNPSRSATEAFEIATQVTGSQLGDMMQSMFQVGDDLQREMVDRLLNMLNPKNTVHTTTEIVQLSAELLKALGPNKGGRVAWQELRNKLTVFNLVYQIPKTLNLPAEPPYPGLSDMVGRAYDLDLYPALWAVEGLGHYYGDTLWQDESFPQNALTDSSDIPAGSLTMLHAGLGMAFAQHLLKGLTHFSSRSDIQKMLKQFITLCKENSTPGYEGAALEGLISRSGAFYGETRPDEMVQIIGSLLADMDPEVYGYFWHGVGRSIYFSPINFLPGYGAIWHPIEMVRREAIDPIARRNAFAGLCWGVTMVNIRHPDVLGNLLNHLNSEDVIEQEGFINGVSSGLMMRQDTTPDAPFIAELISNVPAGCDPTLWENWVQKPCETALMEYYPILKEKHRLGDIFQYRVLGDLINTVLGKF